MNILKVNIIFIEIYISVLLLYKQLFTVYADTKAQHARKIELQLIQSKNNIEKPDIRLFAEPL